METREEKIGPVAILETREGLRVAVYMIREFIRNEVRYGPHVERLAYVHLKTDGNQQVIPEHGVAVATIVGTRNHTLCTVVSGSLDRDWSLNPSL